MLRSATAFVALLLALPASALVQPRSAMLARTPTVAARSQVLVMSEAVPQEVSAVLEDTMLAEAAEDPARPTLLEKEMALAKQGPILSWWAVPFVVYPAMLFANGERAEHGALCERRTAHRTSRLASRACC
jgi:hypothetical protein